MSSISLGRRSDISLVTVISIAVALSFGVSYGDAASNQTTYLLKGIQLARPGLWPRDWWLNETPQYHVVFSRLVSILWLSGLPQSLMAALNTGLIWGSLVAIYLIIVRLQGKQYALLAWSFVTGVFVLGLHASTVSVTYLFSAGLQPSTIATFCFLLGIFGYLRGRYGLSGLALGIGGAVHLNYAIIGIACFGLAHLCAGRAGMIRRLAFQQSGMMLVLLANVPLVLAMQSGGTPEDSRLADDIFFHVRAPFHYDPLSYLPSFLPFAAWHCLALAELTVLPRGAAQDRLWALYLSMLAVIAVALVLTTVVFVPAVARAFFFRLNPFALLIACIIVGSAAAVRLRSADAPSPNWKLQDIPALLIRVAATAIICLFTIRFQNSGFLRSTAIVLLVLAPAMLWARPMLLQFATIGRVVASIRAHQARISIIVVLLMTVASLDRRNFNLIIAPPIDRMAGLFDWAGRTPEAALFLIPPDMADFRLVTRRSVIADSKSVPLGTRGLLAWDRRMAEISGNPGFRSESDLDEGYRHMDSPRMEALFRKYQPDYAVFPNTPLSRNLVGEVVFSDHWFLVLRSSAKRGESGGRPRHSASAG